MDVGHNSLTALPAEMSALTGLASVAAGHNYLDCGYLEKYMREGGVDEGAIDCSQDEQYRLSERSKEAWRW